MTTTSTNATTRTPARTRYGITRLILPSNPPASDPTIMAAPLACCPRANTLSLGPSHPAESNASTIHASTAPVWNVKPSPRSGLAKVNPQKPQPRSGVTTYMTVETLIVKIASRNDARRPIVSATTPVGTSHSACAIRNAVLTSITSNSVRWPRCRRKIVLIAQIIDVASVNSALVDRYARMIRPEV